MIHLRLKSAKDTEKILLSGNSQEIPYNEKNLVYKAADLFYRETETHRLWHRNPYRQKRFQIAAGLAGGRHRCGRRLCSGT